MLDETKSRRTRLLTRAKEVTTRDRNAEYGGPESSFACIAWYWSGYTGYQIDSADVAIMLALLKIARLQTTKGTHIDSWVDLAGYAACGYEVSNAGEIDLPPEAP